MGLIMAKDIKAVISCVTIACAFFLYNFEVECGTPSAIDYGRRGSILNSANQNSAKKGTRLKTGYDELTYITQLDRKKSPKNENLLDSKNTSTITKTELEDLKNQLVLEIQKSGNTITSQVLSQISDSVSQRLSDLENQHELKIQKSENAIISQVSSQISDSVSHLSDQIANRITERIIDQVKQELSVLSEQISQISENNVPTAPPLLEENTVIDDNLSIPVPPPLPSNIDDAQPKTSKVLKETKPKAKNLPLQEINPHQAMLDAIKGGVKLRPISKNQEELIKTSEKSVSSDPHQAMLNAIKGGVKLKKVDPNVPHESQKPIPKKEKTFLELMQEDAERRRAAIIGADDEEDDGWEN